MPLVKIRCFLSVCCFCLVMFLAFNNSDDTLFYQKMMFSFPEKLDLRIAQAPPNTTDTIPSIVIANVSRTLVTRASDRGIYIFTAFTRLVQNKRVVFINGWEEKLLLKEHDHFCCFLLMNGTVLHNNLFLLTRFTYNPRLKATLFGCAVHPSMSDSETFAVSVSVIKHQSVTLPTPAKKALPNLKPIEIKNSGPVKDKNIKPVPIKRTFESGTSSKYVQVPFKKHVFSRRKLLSANIDTSAEKQSERTIPIHSVCPRDPSAYVMPLRPMEVASNKHDRPTSVNGTDKETEKDNSVKDKPFSFAICAKIVYGDAETELAIEWFEYYRRMGASKVLIFTYNISSSAAKMIKHYEDIGFLEVLPFDFPEKGSLKRQVGQKNSQAWNDEQVLVYHCFDRLFNFKYVGIIDLDEFIVPHKDRNFEQLFTRLQMTFKFAANFVFQHMVHVLEWKPASEDRTIVGRYLNHTKSLGYNVKTVFMPDKVRPGSAITHHVLRFLGGYKSVTVLKTIAQLSHYRKRCRPEWVKKGICFNMTRLSTTRILELMDDSLRENILMKKQSLLDTYNTDHQ